MASVLNLGERLEAVVELCPQSHKVADIGCDHGLSGYNILQKNATVKVVFSDISKINSLISLVPKTFLNSLNCASVRWSKATSISIFFGP